MVDLNSSGGEGKRYVAPLLVKNIVNLEQALKNDSISDAEKAEIRQQIKDLEKDAYSA